MSRTDRASLRRLQAVLEDPTRNDHDTRILARLQVGLILARVEGRRLMAELRADHRERSLPR
jgi:hypothetical protein